MTPVREPRHDELAIVSTQDGEPAGVGDLGQRPVAEVA
jgi:hypothetical protein